ncbi:MAG: homoserine dehydrogenase [Rhodospirillales bacterium]|nr:homoserine dehydrogenase [Rhodospirillales bacterium]
MSNPLKIAIAGLGTIGGGTVRLLHENAGLLKRRCGRDLVVSGVCDLNKELAAEWPDVPYFADALSMVADADADVIVELIGGSDGIAKTLCDTAIAAGKHVVTANKALIAHHGTALVRSAENKGVSIAFEAAVAGGIPITKALREGLVGNEISRVYGILNGTCNYILTTMRETGREFDDVLAEAQELGYAEADPTFDVEGVDAAHKLAILTSIAFGCEINFDAVHIEGIRHVSAMDIDFAEELNYRIKLLGIARRTEFGIEQRVHPCMVPLANPIAHVDGVFNAVVADGDYVDTTMYEGRGAGERPTASAVVADIVDIARGNNAAALGVPVSELESFSVSPMGQHRGRYFVRLMVSDKTGVFADVAAILRDCEVSMEAVLQKGRSPDDAVPVVLTTHETSEASMRRALEMIQALDAVIEQPRMIRIQSFSTDPGGIE